MQSYILVHPMSNTNSLITVDVHTQQAQFTQSKIIAIYLRQLIILIDTTYTSISTLDGHMRHLHIRSRVLYKQCILMYRINCVQAPKYITDLVSTVAATATRSGLRSENTTNYCLPRLRIKFGERAFSYAGPAAWNKLPQNIRASASLNILKRKR